MRVCRIFRWPVFLSRITAPIVLVTGLIGCGSDVGVAPSGKAASLETLKADEKADQRTKGKGKGLPLENAKSIKGRALEAGGDR
jgi:hypothetical protein